MKLIFVSNLHNSIPMYARTEVTTVAGTATEDEDYEPLSMVLDFPARQSTITFDLSLIDDEYSEATDETLSVILSDPVDGELGDIALLSVVIRDNEGMKNYLIRDNESTME